MRNLFMPGAWLCAIALLVAANPAQAAGIFSPTYVAIGGADTGNCETVAHACGSYTYAQSQTADFGEIDCVNQGIFGGIPPQLTITQSLTIDAANCPGSTVPITINGPGIVVRLRNLTLDGGGLGGAGVDAKNLASLSLENCVITNSNNGNQNASAPYVGVMFEPSASADLFISNSIIGNNGAASSSGSGGVDIVPAAGATVQVVIDHSQINRNYFGVVGDGRNGGIIRGTISDSVIAGNLSNGVTAISTSSSVVFLLDQTKVTGNHIGLFASGSNAGMLVRNTSIFSNTTGLDTVSGGRLLTYGNNSVVSNPTDGAFTGTATLQ